MPSKTQAVARANTSTRSTTRATSADHEQPEPTAIQAPDAVLSGEDSEEEPVETYSNLDDPLVEDLEETLPNTGNSFTPAQLATIESMVQSSVDLVLQSFSISANLPFMGATPSYSGTQPRRAGTATPLGFHRPLERSFEDKILRSEFIDFTLLLLDSLTQTQLPELQLRLDDLSPGSLSSPLSMVRKRKPVINTFHKWLDAYMTYMLVNVATYSRCSIELLKYQRLLLAGRKPSFKAWLGSRTMNSFVAGPQMTCP